MRASLPDEQQAGFQLLMVHGSVFQVDNGPSCDALVSVEPRESRPKLVIRGLLIVWADVCASPSEGQSMMIDVLTARLTPRFRDRRHLGALGGS